MIKHDDLFEFMENKTGNSTNKNKLNTPTTNTTTDEDSEYSEENSSFPIIDLISNNKSKKNANTYTNNNTNINLITHNNNTYIIKSRLVQFDSSDFYTKLKKGKQNKTNNIEEHITNIDNNSFYHKRFYLFSQYDKGIKLDKESWYSVTPEELSEYIALKIQDKSVIDAFCGAGGNTIQFSRFCKQIKSIDIDSVKIDYCKNNMKIYEEYYNENNSITNNNTNNVELIQSDFLNTNIDTNYDHIFLSPPWGGTNYINKTKYLMKENITPDIDKILAKASILAKNIVLYLPRNIDLYELFDLFSANNINSTPNTSNSSYFEVEFLYSANKIKAVLIFIGEDYTRIKTKYIKEYLKQKYEVHNSIVNNTNIAYHKNTKLESYKYNQMITLIKFIGLESFLLAEKEVIDETISLNIDINPVISFMKIMTYIKTNILNEEEFKQYKNQENRNSKKRRKQEKN